VTVIGGRLGQIILYEPAYYAVHPLEIIEIWNGGMAFHGGLIGVLLAIWYFAYRFTIPFLTVADLCGATCPIPIFLVRIGNFINQEHWGRPTDVPWAVVFPDVDAMPRHPSQLYEATLEGVVLFIVLAIAMRLGALKRPGLVIGIFAVGYAIARTTCEFFREPDVQLGFLWQGTTMGMLLSIPLFLAGVAFIVYAMKQSPLRSA